MPSLHTRRFCVCRAAILGLALVPITFIHAAAPAKADRWVEVPALQKGTIPMSGDSHASLTAVDEAIREFMAAKRIPAVSFAVSRNGRVLHERAFGWADADLKTPLPVGLSMRLASITKPLTQAAIRTLFASGRLRPEDPVFEVLELQKFGPANLDPRWKDITIQHLLEHKGGWDRAKSGDFTYRSKTVAADLRVPLPALEPMDLVKWALERPLDFDPGARDVYSNFGYILLARVVEKRGGESFVMFLRNTIGKTAGMTTLLASRSDASDREPGEVWYALFPEYRRPEQPWSLRVETKDGSGGLACSAADYCRFLEHYTVSGKPRVRGGRYSGTFFGSTPGATSVCTQRPDGICYTAICNRRAGANTPESWNRELKEAIDRALEPVAPKL